MAEKTSYVIPGVALILIGFATGWFLQGARQQGHPIISSAATPPKTTRVDEQLKSALKEITAQTDPAARREAIERIPEGKMRAYLQALRTRAGLRGLSSEDREILSMMLAVWHTRDPEDTLNWILAHEQEESRIHLLYSLLENSDSLAPLEATKLGVKFLITSDGHLEFPTKVLQAAADAGGESLLACLSLAVHPSARRTDVVLDFPEDFEFAAFAEQYSNHLESLPEGTRQLVTPANLAEEWAKHEPAAAFVWASHHPEAATPQGLAACIALIAASPPKQAGAILARAVGINGAHPELVVAGLNRTLHLEPNPQILTHFLASQKNPEERESLLTSLFLTTIGLDQELYSARVRHLILARMSAEERLSFLGEIMGGGSLAPSQLQLNGPLEVALREELERLDHSPEEISTIMEHFKVAQNQSPR